MLRHRGIFTLNALHLSCKIYRRPQIMMIWLIMRRTTKVLKLVFVIVRVSVDAAVLMQIG